MHERAARGGIRRKFLNGAGSLLGYLAWLLGGDGYQMGGGWIPRALEAALCVVQTIGADAAFCTSGWDPMFAAVRLKRQLGIPWILDLTDPWEMFYVSVARFFYLTPFYRRFVPSAASLSQCTPGWARELSRKVGRPVACLISGFDADELDRVEARRFDRFTVVYVGNAESGNRDPSTFFAGLSLLGRMQPEVGSKVQVVYVGSNYDFFRQRASEQGVNEFLHCTGQVKLSEVTPYVKGAHLLLVAIDNRLGFNQGRLTAKVGEYLGTDRPILLMTQPLSECSKTDLARLIGETGVGWVAENAEAVAEVLRRLLKQYQATRTTMRPGGGRYAVGDFTWHGQSRKLASLLDQIAAGKRDPVLEDIRTAYPWGVQGK
jgi:glycosyltransferase involved in cell wall biosynthesis